MPPLIRAPCSDGFVHCGICLFSAIIKIACLLVSQPPSSDFYFAIDRCVAHVPPVQKVRPRYLPTFCNHSSGRAARVMCPMLSSEHACRSLRQTTGPASATLLASLRWRHVLVVCSYPIRVRAFNDERFGASRRTSHTSTAWVKIHTHDMTFSQQYRVFARSSCSPVFGENMPA